MTDRLEIRESAGSDAAQLEELYPQAFPDEDLLPLLRDLLDDGRVAMSLVATVDSKLAGHGVFTDCGVTGTDAKASLLGPLAVAPEYQRRGIGSAIVWAGLEALSVRGVELVCVLGDPAYYGRFGFVADARIEPPYRLPAEWSGAWQSLYLHSSKAPLSGKLAVPRPWRDPALWAP